MIQAGDGASFNQTGFRVFRAANKSAMRYLDRNKPLQLVVMSQIDASISALSQHTRDPVATNAFFRLSREYDFRGLLILRARPVCSFVKALCGF